MIPWALLAAVTIDAAAIAQTSATLNALGPHPFGSPRNQAAGQFVAAKLKEAGLPQTVIQDFVFEGASGTNVVASLPGRSDRLLIIATHHDSAKDAQDVSSRSRSLSLLIEIARQASRLQPARTWILASFDGGESKGEGFAHYLDGLGKSRGLIEGVVLIDATALQETTRQPSLIAPACPSGVAPAQRGIAGRALVSAAIGGVPPSLAFSFDDPGINLLTQPFIRSFRTTCAPTAARAIAAELGVIVATDASYSRRFLAGAATSAPVDPALRDNGAALLGEVAFAAIQGIDTVTPSSPQSDSWLVVGRSVWPGWLMVLVGAWTLIPGIVAVRSGGVRLAIRVAYSAAFAAFLYSEPEVALFALALPTLAPPSLPKKYLALTLIPLLLLISAGAMGFIRGQVTGSWLSVWIWAGLLGCIAILFASKSAGKKAPAKSKRSKR